MAATGYLGVRSPGGGVPNADPMSELNAEDLVEVLLQSNHEMVAAARQWEENAAQEKRELEVEIRGLRARCAEYEAIIGENEQSLRKQLAESGRSVKGLTEALLEEAKESSQENAQLRSDLAAAALEVEQLQRERDEATLRARSVEKAGKAQAKEVTSLRKELAAERDRKGMSLQDARELNEQL